MNNNIENFRNPTVIEPRVFGPNYASIQTPLGRVPTSSTQIPNPPPLPPRPFCQQPQQSMLMNQMGSYRSGMYGNNMYGSSGYGGYGGYSMAGGYGGYGMGGPGAMGGMGGYGAGMYGSPYSGMNPNDPENRFIQMAEETSRPAFQSIESLVMAIGNIASMLDSTFFALTNSFRAVLGVAANFGRLRGVFAQFWSTFAMLRGITWLYKKCLYLLGASKSDPSSMAFNEVFNAAMGGIPGNASNLPGSPGNTGSAWPILAFLSFIITAPYLISKLVGKVMTTAVDESKNPKSWVAPLKSQAIYSFEATNPQELSIRAGQTIMVAPREVQQTQKLLNTGWVLASVDYQQSGLIPVNYLRRDTNVVSTPQKSDVDRPVDQPADQPIDISESMKVAFEENLEHELGASG